jgi:Papain family cysteine protease
MSWRFSCVLTTLIVSTVLTSVGAYTDAAAPDTHGAPLAQPQTLASALPSQAIASKTSQHPVHHDLRLPPGTNETHYDPLPPQTLLGETTILPPSVDLSRFAPPVGDQGWVSDCAAWATVYTLAGWYINKEHLATGYLAPLFTYSQVDGGRDEGTWESQVLTAVQHGMLPLADYPQGNYAWRSQPTAAQRALARHLTFTGVMYYPGHTPRVGDPRDWDTDPNLVRRTIETALAAGRPMLIGTAVYANLYDATATSAWIAPVQADPAAPLGGHELVAIGYDNAGAWVENSWGTAWGLNGYAEISWPYLEANVSSMVTVGAVHLTAPLPAGRMPATPTIRATVLRDGTPQSRTAVLADGEEVALAGTGFGPNDVVSLYWDGVDRGYVTTLPDGTWSLEWYDHQQSPISAHNIRPTPGKHILEAREDGGTRATISLTVA